MVEIKLQKLPDRTPVKLSVNLPPDLHADLVAYAAFYRETYGAEEPIADLVPHMLAAFLASDRAFAKSRKSSQS